MTDAQRQFIDRQHAKLKRFVSDVSNNRIIVNKSIKLSVKRYLKDLENPAYDFRTDKVDKFFYFLSYIKLNQDNQYVTFEPEPWQVFYFANLYGFYYAGTNSRRFTTSFLTIARKNGKTTLGAIQALYHFTHDGTIDAQVYFISGSRDLATTGLTIAKNIVDHSPALKKRVRNLQYSIRYKTNKTNNILKAMTGDPESLNSIRPAFAVIDETHVMVNSDLVDMLKSGQVGIKNPLMSIISTRGFNNSWYQYGYEKYLSKVLSNEVKDESTFIMMFGLDDEEEIQAPEMWAKSNPNLFNPKILTLSQLTDIFEQKRFNLSGLRNFVVLNLNFWWESSEDCFIPSEILDRVFTSIDPEIIENEDCYLGIDLSSTKDITSISLVFPPSINHNKYIVRNFNIKTNSVENRVRKTGIDLSDFIASGELIELKNDTIDYDYLFELIADLAERFNIVKIGYDKFNSALLIPKVKNEIGLDCVDVPQTASKLNFPTKFIEKLMHDDNVLLDNRVNKWMFGNVVLYRDTNNNIKPMKNKSLDSIDGVVSILNALFVYLEGLDGEEFYYLGDN